MNPIVLAVLIVAILGLVAGLLLAIASIVMAVPVDEKAVAIEEVLAGANCGACGYSGCAGYAAALAAGECEDTSLCSPGGSACAKAVAEIMGVAAGDSTPMTAVVLCHGTEANAANIMDYNGNLSVSGNYGVLKSTAQKTGANMVRGLNDNLTSGEDFNLKSYLFPYNYMYPDIYGSGAWLVSLLRKDGTWDLVYRQDPYGALVTKMSEWNISPNYEQYQRTCDGYIRCRITHYYKKFDQLYRKEYYNIANYYYVLDYLPQQVKMRYSAPEKASSALFAETASMSDDYTQDIKITIKNLEGVNNVIVEQFDEGNDLPLKFEVNDFKKGYFIANVEKDLSTKFVVYSYNKNGYAKSETLIVPPSVVYNSDVKINGNKISIDNGLLTKHGPINYAIYSTSPSSVIQVKEGVLKDKNTMIGISELAKGSYILVLKSGITSKSVKFVK